MSKTVTIGGETIEITARNEKEYEAFIAASQKRDAWPQTNELVHVIYSDGEILSVPYTRGFIKHLTQGRVKPTLAEAEQLRDKEQAQARIDAYIRENGLEFVPDWSNHSRLKWYPCYEHGRTPPAICACAVQISQTATGFFVATREHANAIIAACEADLKIVLGVK